MEGGPGNDTYVVDSRSDVVVERAGQGADSVLSPVSFTLPVNVETLVLTGTAPIDGTGNAGANTLRGNAAANRLFGADGNDRIDGLAGDDLLRGGAGNDVLDGGVGADRMEGGTGDDTYLVDNRADRVVEAVGAGSDRVVSTVSHVLAANVEALVLAGASPINGAGNGLDNRITGNAAANTLNGGAGSDLLEARGGDDVLIGGLGTDELSGGLGIDVFRFLRALDSGVGATADRIADFEVCDLIDLSAIDACMIGPGKQDFAFIGTADFSGTSGELRAVSGLVAADLNGDAIADFEIVIANLLTPAADNFIL
jgi:Ca2+-binding RTX toxin-like protein